MGFAARAPSVVPRCSQAKSYGGGITRGAPTPPPRSTRSPARARACPTNRAVDGVDETAFLLGKQEKSAREWFPVFQAGGAAGAPDLCAMKWRNYKMHLIWQERQYDSPQRLPVPRLIDLYDNPQERPEEAMTGESAVVTHGCWAAHAMFAYLSTFQASLKTYPPIPPGAPDSYAPTPTP